MTIDYQSSPKRGATPFEIKFTDGYTAVKQCVDKKHAHERAAEDHPDKTVFTVEQVR